MACDGTQISSSTPPMSNGSCLRRPAIEDPLASLFKSWAERQFVDTKLFRWHCLRHDDNLLPSEGAQIRSAFPAVDSSTSFPMLSVSPVATTERRKQRAVIATRLVADSDRVFCLRSTYVISCCDSNTVFKRVPAHVQNLLVKVDLVCISLLPHSLSSRAPSS